MVVHHGLVLHVRPAAGDVSEHVPAMFAVGFAKTAGADAASRFRRPARQRSRRGARRRLVERRELVGNPGIVQPMQTPPAFMQPPM